MRHKSFPLPPTFTSSDLTEMRLEIADLLAEARWTGAYLAAGRVSWRDWLFEQRWLNPGKKYFISARVADSLFVFRTCYHALVAANAERGDDPLPLPQSPSETTPFRGSLQRVQDWDTSGWPRRPLKEDRIAPYAQEQPLFVEIWEQVWRFQSPHHWYDGDGNPLPPHHMATRAWFSRERLLHGWEPSTGQRCRLPSM